MNLHAKWPQYRSSFWMCAKTRTSKDQHSKQVLMAEGWCTQERLQKVYLTPISGTSLICGSWGLKFLEKREVWHFVLTPLRCSGGLLDLAMCKPRCDLICPSMIHSGVLFCHIDLVLGNQFHMLFPLQAMLNVGGRGPALYVLCRVIREPVQYLSTCQYYLILLLRSSERYIMFLHSPNL